MGHRLSTAASVNGLLQSEHKIEENRVLLQKLYLELSGVQV